MERLDVPEWMLGWAAHRLDATGLYEESVDIRRVRVRVSSWFFKIPGVRNFDGFALSPRWIFLRPGVEWDHDLLTHELCHVWQMQHGWLGMALSYLHGYADNPYEEEARFAVWQTREMGVQALLERAAVEGV